jgi:hypothetical protein
LYQGSLSLHYFGNDTTTGSTPPFDAYVFTALPLGAHCNPAMPGGMACNPTATLQVGAPLTGNGTATLGGGSPASIMLPSGQLGRITSGSFPLHYAGLTYSKTYANLLNAAGSFQPGGGPGSVSHSFSSGLRAKISPGEKQFGGVMRLLKGAPAGGLGAKLKSKFGLYNYYIYNIQSWGVTVVGANSSGGSPAYGFVTASFYPTWHPTSPGLYTGVVEGWPWTTGMVTVTAISDYSTPPPLNFPEHLVRTGYDNRTSQGAGTIQLVTPHLTDWITSDLQYAAIGVLRLEFAPEPPSGLILLAGAGLLGALYRRRTR